MTVLVVLAYVVAVARLTRLVVDDQLTLPLRRRIVDTYGVDDWRTYLAHCSACVSIYTAVALMPLLIAARWHWAFAVPLYALAASQITILLKGLERD